MDLNVETIARQRNTFGHRVYDDLCEDLLLWLPIGDKLKLRSVSQQFNQCLETLLKRQRVLDLKELYRPGQKEFNYMELNEILRRCPNVKEVHFEGSCYACPPLYVLPKITAMVNNLESVEFRFYYRIERSDLKTFAEKFGPNLKSIALFKSRDLSDESVKHMLKCSTQLKSLTVDLWTLSKVFIFENEGIIKKTVVRNLENLKIKTKSNFNSQEISEIVDKNQCLKNLAIDLVIETQGEASVAIRTISELKELTDLKINFVGSSLALSAVLIAESLKKLKYLSLSVFYELEFDAMKLFNKLKECSSLIRIHIGFQCIFGDEVNFDINYIRKCKQLTHLSLHSGQLIITEEFWKQISLSFIKLKEINLSSSIQPEITDTDLICLSKCKNLQKVVLVTYHNVLPAVTFTELGFISLVNDCNDLFSIRCHIPFLVTESLHKAMVAKAVKNPDIEYNYQFGSPYGPDHSGRLTWFPTSIDPPDPSNLRINYI